MFEVALIALRSFLILKLPAATKLPPIAIVLLALDMYEHSYHMEFGAKAAGYVDTFMDAIRWNNVERVFHQASGE